jgi:hypothetical protein
MSVGGLREVSVEEQRFMFCLALSSGPGSGGVHL